MKHRILITLMLITFLCTSCISKSEKIQQTETESIETFLEETTSEEAIEEPIETSPAETTAESTQPMQKITFPEDFVYPATDGSTSTTNLEKAVKTALYGGDPIIKHTKTYQAFWNLLQGSCELIFTTPLSAEQLEKMNEAGFQHEAEPVAGEGFVFVVNKDNPVDTLTIDQIKGIYSGEITNWSEVGGNDAEILAYQRNSDSGSQNYMISFMGDTPLMQPITNETPASMSGILNVIAAYDNGVNAIGYSVYAYSDGMYENISQIKYIKVNGVEPSHETLADGTYPLLGYNYAVFSADEHEDSNVRTLVKWMQSDEGQQVIADAGYIPYRKVEGLTLNETTGKVLYTVEATSGIAKPETMADYYFNAGIPESFKMEGLNEKIEVFITEATNELSLVDKARMKAFVEARAPYGFDPDIVTRKNLFNGYLSVIVGLRYNLGVGDSPDYYYDVRTAVFDIYTGERLELSDLFFEGVDFVPLLNNCLAAEAEKPYDNWGYHEMLRDFTGLYEGDFTFTADSIIFKPNTCFADGVQLSVSDLAEYMVTSIPRDMIGYLSEEETVYKNIRLYYPGMIGYGETRNEITIWYLDKKKAPVTAEVCDRINGFIDNLYENHFTEEKLLADVREIDAAFESVSVGPWPDFDVNICGERYIEFSGANTAFPIKAGEASDIQITVIEGHNNPYHFHYYFNSQTGEELRVNDLFTEGWEEQAKIYILNEYFDMWNTADAYTAEVSFESCRITGIPKYSNNIPYYTADTEAENWTAMVYAVTETGDNIAIAVPQKYILGS
ncbi:MAG: substrate-binding domain-containing protein, partial [Clostridia bacterium]|nr:substrate-binding domain-containing protein [Clostridia bacterium]